MSTVGICIVVQDNLQLVKYVTQNLLACDQGNTEKRLYIFDNGSQDKKVSEYCEGLCNMLSGYFKSSKEPIPIAQALNTLVRVVGQDYCCIFPSHTLVCNHWLTDLVFYHKRYDDSGIAAIRYPLTEIDYMPLLYTNHPYKSEGELEHAIVPKNNTLDGVMLFETGMLNVIGEFDQELKNGAEAFINEDLCIRFSGIGKHNFYLRSQIAAKYQTDNETLFPQKTFEGETIFKRNVEAMMKKKQFKKGSYGRP